jgi:hypothetical protein
MDLVAVDGVAVEVRDRLDYRSKSHIQEPLRQGEQEKRTQSNIREARRKKCLTLLGFGPHRDLVALHNLLNGLSDVTHPNIDSSRLRQKFHVSCRAVERRRTARTNPNPSVGGVLDGLEEFVIRRFKGEGEGRVDDSSVDVNAKVDFENVPLLENCAERRKPSATAFQSLPKASCLASLVLSFALGAVGTTKQEDKHHIDTQKAIRGEDVLKWAAHSFMLTPVGKPIPLCMPFSSTRALVPSSMFCTISVIVIPGLMVFLA